MRVPDAIRVCGACLRDAPPLDGVLAAMDYAHPWDRLIAGFKFHGALDLADALADSLARAWRASGASRPQWLLPVPLSRERLQERGFNQSWEIARRLARRLGCRADSRVLIRCRDTRHQLALPVERRADNVRNAFAIESRYLPAVQGQRVTLVDDVLTTGATATELARLLRRAGASQVHLWVLARTPSPHE